MRSIAIFVGLLNLHVLASAGPSADHLLPLDPGWSPEYRNILTQKLGVTGFDCGRVLVKPPFEKPEEAISVHSNKSAGADIYGVTCTVAEESIWDVTNGGAVPDRAKGLKVRRYDAEIGRHTAEAVRRAWLVMLKEVHGRFPPAPEERQIIPGDPTQVEFALERAHAPPLYGQLNVFLESQGDKVNALLTLTEQLRAYCQAQPDQRRPIASRIEQTARKVGE